MCQCVSHSISRILFHSWRVNSGARLPQSFFNTAAVQENILLSRVAVVVAENLEDMRRKREKELYQAALIVYTNTHE